MPERTPEQREAISRAIRRALHERHLSHNDVARILGLSAQTVSNAISQADFSDEKALRWSVALNIPVEVFTIGVEPMPINDYEHIINEIKELRKDISDLRSDINDLNRRYEEHIDSHRAG